MQSAYSSFRLRINVRFDPFAGGSWVGPGICIFNQLSWRFPLQAHVTTPLCCWTRYKDPTLQAPTVEAESSEGWGWDLEQKASSAIDELCDGSSFSTSLILNLPVCTMGMTLGVPAPVVGCWDK